MKSSQQWIKTAAIIVVGMAWLNAPAVRGTERYVSPSGTEAGGYTNWTTAAKTIQKAVNACTNGDTVLVTNGTYVLTNQVSITNGVTVKGFGGASATVVNGGYPARTNRCFSLKHAAAVLDGLTITAGHAVPANDGGGIYIDGGGTVQNCIIVSNSSDTANGSGAYLNGGSMVSNCVFCLNSARGSGYGGAVYMDSGTVQGCTITSNTCQYGGGGVDVRNGLVSDCTIMGNTGYLGGGGGITLWGGSTARNCLIANNQACNGGGLYFADMPSVAENCTIVSNRAYGYGGGSGSGGGVQFNIASTNLTLRNSIIWSNVNAYGQLNNYGGASTNISYSCTTPLPIGSGNTASNPLFVSQASGNYRLSTGSPCVDKGTNIMAWMAGATDLDGNARIANGTVDIGTYEFTSASDTTPPGNVTSLTATGGNALVVLRWTNPTNSDFAGVKIQRKTTGYPSSTTDGTTIYNANGTNTTDTGLANGTTYYYTAFSYDFSTNYASGSTATATPQVPHTATGTSVIVSGFIVGVTLGDGGYGYTNIPLVRFFGGGGTGAVAVAIVSNGVVTGVTVTDAGSGYTGTVIVVISPPFIQQPLADSITLMTLLTSTNLAVGTNYQLQTFQPPYWNNIGSAFTASSSAYSLYRPYMAPNVYRLGVTPVPRQAFATGQVVNGFVVGVTVTNGGSGYVTNPAVQFVGDGSGAQAASSVTTGAVSAITVLNAGTGYTNGVAVQIDPPPAVSVFPDVTPYVTVNFGRLSPYDNYGLECAQNLPGVWSTYGGVVVPTSTSNTFYIPATNSRGFYRASHLP